MRVDVLVPVAAGERPRGERVRGHQERGRRDAAKMKDEFIVDISKSPIWPPNISVSEWGTESEESKKRSLAWDKYIDEYNRALDVFEGH